MGDNLDLAVGRGRDGNVVSEVVDTALNLDAVLEELLEGSDIEDLVVGGLRSINDELLGGLGTLGALLGRLRKT